MRCQIAAVAVPAVLGEIAADEVVQPEFLGAGPGVGLAAGAPQDDVAAVSCQVFQDIARTGPERGAGQRVEQAAVHVEDPAVDDGGCGRRRRGRRRVRCGRLAGRIVAGQAIGGHYWYTLFAMQHAWDRRLGFWYLAQEYPDQPAVVASPSGVTLTFAELAGRAHQLVHGLRARGLKARDIFAYALPNDVDMLCWQLAAQEGGFASIALNPALSGSEVQRIVDHSEAVALVLHHDFADRVGQMSGTGSIGLRVSVGGDIPGFTSERELVQGQPTTEPPDRALGLPINYSSGTTGQPKAVIRPRTRHGRPFRGRRRREVLRSRLPVPAPDGCAPDFGRHAPRRLPGLLSRRPERRAGGGHSEQVRPGGDLGLPLRGTGSPRPTWSRRSSCGCCACPRR